jgi:uncharacterized protein (TIGR03086 family)
MSPAAPSPSRALLLTAADLMASSLRFDSLVSPTLPTPCSEWQLGQLVGHVAESAAELGEIIGGLPPAAPAATRCTRARLSVDHLRRAVADAPDNDPAADLAAVTGAFELTIHAWDIDTAVGAACRLPAEHVRALMRLAPLVLGGVDRGGLFGPSLPPPPPGAADAQRLLALFGRRGG